jgi:hypothetical protein
VREESAGRSPPHLAAPPPHSYVHIECGRVQQLRCGFNLLFHGFGSKKELLESFAKAQLVDGSVVVINGYFPRLSLKELAATVLSVLGRGAADELRSHTLQVRDSPCTRKLSCFEFEETG